MNDTPRTDWHLGPMLPFDTETTGTDVENDRIVSATVAYVQAGGQPVYWSQLVKVDVPIPPEATRVHGITNQQCDELGRPEQEVLSGIVGRLMHAKTNGYPVVGMNLTFDFTILDRRLRATDPDGRGLDAYLQGEPFPVVDVRVLDKALTHRKGGRTLGALCEHWGVRHDGAHDARYDAIAAARLAFKIKRVCDHTADYDRQADFVRDFPGAFAGTMAYVSALTLPALHEWQRKKHAAQCASLRAYFNRQGTKHDGVDPSWPVRPFGRVAVRDDQA